MEAGRESPNIYKLHIDSSVKALPRHASAITIAIADIVSNSSLQF